MSGQGCYANEFSKNTYLKYPTIPTIRYFIVGIAKCVKINCSEIKIDSFMLIKEDEAFQVIQNNQELHLN